MITTYYRHFYDTLQDNDPSNDELEFEQYFAVSEILSFKRFDMDHFDNFGAIDKAIKVKVTPLKPSLSQKIANLLKTILYE